MRENFDPRAVLEPPSTQEAQMIKKEPYWRLTCRACVARDAADGSELVIRMRPDLEFRDGLSDWREATGGTGGGGLTAPSMNP